MLLDHNFESFLCDWRRMRGGIVLLKYNVVDIIFMKEINKGKKILFKELNIDLFVDSFINKNERTKLVANKAPPNHLRQSTALLFPFNILWCIHFGLTIGYLKSRVVLGQPAALTTTLKILRPCGGSKSTLGQQKYPLGVRLGPVNP
jgi:hypothetical protein